MVQMFFHRSILAASVVALSLPQIAGAQWTVTNLHPANASQSRAYSASGASQVGTAGVDGSDHACMWTGTAGSWIDLHPTGAASSGAFGVFGAQQVGSAFVGTGLRARAWSGNSGTPINLHPGNASSSEATGSNGTQQVGYAIISGVQRASLWNGSSTRTDLHPVGATQSWAWAISGTQQAGWIRTGGVTRATIWKGTAGSMVDLHPVGATISQARATSGTQQAGWAFINGSNHASLWTGTAASWIDLQPLSATASTCSGTDGTHQVGYAVLDNKVRASLWIGSASSWINLHALLSSDFSYSEAYSVSTDGSKLYVAGYGYNLVTDRDEALLWTHPVRPVSGTIDLPGWIASRAGIPKVIEIRNVGETTPLQSATVKLDDSGQYSFLALVPPGTYDITAKGTHWLRRLRGSVVISNTGATGINFSLINGDCDGNNDIGTDDYLILSNAFDLSLGEPGYDARADLNGDNYIGTDDYIILNNNFDQSGD